MPNLAAGSGNIAIGFHALNAVSNGGGNIATGGAALQNTTIGFGNTATGADVLGHNTAGFQNVASGNSAMFQSVAGNHNVATGEEALKNTTSGNDNTAIGFQALFDASGDSNVALGSLAGADLTAGSRNVDIANVGKAGDKRVIRIGTPGAQRKTFLAGVSGTSIPGPAQPVLVNSKGQLGTATAAASAKSTVSARKFSRLQRQVNALRLEVSQLRANG
jgi:hypothetical protein